MNRTTSIDKSELAALRKDILTLPADYARQIRGARIEKVYRAVEAFKREYLTLHWLHLYIGSRGKKVALVVKELFRLYPAFNQEMMRKRTAFPASEGQFNCGDEDVFQRWLRRHSIYFGKTFGAIAWLGFRSREVNWFFVWRNQQKYKPEGPDFMPFDAWFEKMRAPPEKVLAEVKVLAEDYKAVAKGIPSVAQLYADTGGRVAVVRDSELDIKTERFLTVAEVAKLLQVPDQTVYNWVSEGSMPSYRKEGKLLRFKWDEVREWYAQYRQRGRKSRTPEGW